VVACATRERARAVVRAAFPRRKARLVLTRTAAEVERCFRAELVDAVVLDVAAPTEDTWRVARLAGEFPTAAWFGLAPYRSADGAAVGRLAAAEFADVLAEGIDDGVARDLVLPRGFTARFAAALADPPDALGLASPVQRAAWRGVVACGGRVVRTEVVAEQVGLTREHLSRSFAAGGAPNLKRVIDLVRLLAAAELAKNPGYDVGDVAAVLSFASSSHLASTAQRVAGTRPASLARLRAVDLVARFVEGRQRSRLRPQA
jgi:AraC-like DNA-binding protein